ncbi:27030_t:CDS:2, partial [Gigaspora margarita]
LDGWTSPTIESIYNYIVTTNIRKEYLIGLNDYSSNSHTGEFLTNEILDIVEKLSSDKFVAIVTDAASNCNLACQKIQEIYPHIWNIRCAAYAVNLIASDLVKLDNLKKLIVNCEKINNFFNSSYLSHLLLVKEFTDMKIKGDSLKVWLLFKHKESITNQEIANLIANEDFFTMYRLGSFKKQPHLPELALRIFSITPTQANCDRQTSLDINKLEGMSKIKSYYTANIQHKLNFFDQTDANNEPSLEDMFNDSTILLIGEICDLETEEISESFAVNTVQAESLNNLDYDPCDMLNNFLEHEKQRS